MNESATPLTKSPDKLKRMILAMVGVPLVITLIVLAFLWPAKTTAPRHLPVSLAGPPEAVQPFSAAMTLTSPGLFNFIEATDRADAIVQIENRQTLGAIILANPPEAMEVLTAPAGSPVAAQMLEGIAKQIQAQTAAQLAATGGDPARAQVELTPVVSFDPKDPSGSGIGAMAFPLVIAGAVGGVAISLLVSGAVRRLLALLGFSLVAGLLLSLVLGPWFGFLPANVGINTVVVGLSTLATAAFIVGCAAFLGRYGLAFAVVLTILVGNPLSAAAMPWQFMTRPWGAIGQLMVPGASNWLIRSANYFSGAGATKQWLVLGCWAAVGLALVGLSHLRRSSEPLGLPIPKPATS